MDEGEEVVEMKTINIPDRLDLQHGSGGKGSVSLGSHREPAANRVHILKGVTCICRSSLYIPGGISSFLVISFIDLANRPLQK
jgi:hypothetical protein